MAYRSRLTRKQRAVLVRLSCVAALAIAIVSFDRGHITTGLEAVAYVALLTGWFLAFRIRTTCGVIGVSGMPCQVTVKGRLFGCRVRPHYWAKFLARFGMQRGATRAYQHSRGGQASSAVHYHISQVNSGAAASGQVTIGIGKQGGRFFSAFMAIATLAVGAVSAIAGVLAIH